jgi:toxoflavin synthase
MIQLARDQEASEQLGIEYIVGNAREPVLGGQYDLAIAAYLLNQARDRAELGAVYNGIASCLKPGGRFIMVNCSRGLSSRAFVSRIWI